jgi:hypothetical protein
MRISLLISLLLLNIGAAPTTRVVEIDAGATKVTAKLKEVTARQLFESWRGKAARGSTFSPKLCSKIHR